MLSGLIRIGALMTADSAAAGGVSMYSSWTTLIMLGILAAVFYFFMYRPQKKQEQETSSMRSGLEVGDEVTTVGGIIGAIVSIKGETVTIETSADRTKIRVLRDSIRSVDVPIHPKEDAAPAKTEKKKKKNSESESEPKTKLNGEEKK